MRGQLGDLTRSENTIPHGKSIKLTAFRIGFITRDTTHTGTELEVSVVRDDWCYWLIRSCGGGVIIMKVGLFPGSVIRNNIRMISCAHTTSTESTVSSRGIAGSEKERSIGTTARGAQTSGSVIAKGKEHRVVVTADIRAESDGEGLILCSQKAFWEKGADAPQWTYCVAYQEMQERAASARRTRPLCMSGVSRKAKPPNL